MHAESACDVAPNDVAPAPDRLPAFLDHQSFLGGDEIVQRIAPHADEAAGLQQRLDLLARPAREEWKLIADRGVLRTRAGIFRGRGHGGGELTVAGVERVERAPAGEDDVVATRFASVATADSGRTVCVARCGPRSELRVERAQRGPREDDAVRDALGRPPVVISAYPPARTDGQG